MKALITGASSGIGKDFAINLSKLGYDLILVARNEKKLKEVSKLCNTNVTIFYQYGILYKITYFIFFF